jgi:hypothetical protein
MALGIQVSCVDAGVDVDVDVKVEVDVDVDVGWKSTQDRRLTLASASYCQPAGLHLLAV